MQLIKLHFHTLSPWCSISININWFTIFQWNLKKKIEGKKICWFFLSHQFISIHCTVKLLSILISSRVHINQAFIFKLAKLKIKLVEFLMKYFSPLNIYDEKYLKICADTSIRWIYKNTKREREPRYCKILSLRTLMINRSD